MPVGRMMETTSYCGEANCGNYVRGSYKHLKLDVWNRYYSSGPEAGRPYSGLTASGTEPHEPKAGLFSEDSIERPWMIPIRVVLFPWFFLPEDGTIAADTRYYPFGTRMYVPGYGWGTVEDRGSAIKGPNRLDLYFDNYDEAMNWGRRRVRVRIEKP
jgi:3D domain